MMMNVLPLLYNVYTVTMIEYYYNRNMKDGDMNERKEKSFICGQWGTEHFIT